MHDGILKYAQQRIFSRFPLPPLKATGDEAARHVMKTTFLKHDHHQLRRILRLQLQPTNKYYGAKIA